MKENCEGGCERPTTKDIIHLPLFVYFLIKEKANALYQDVRAHAAILKWRSFGPRKINSVQEFVHKKTQAVSEKEFRAAPILAHHSDLGYLWRTLSQINLNLMN